MKCDRDKPRDIYKGEHSPAAVAHFHHLLLLLPAAPGCAEDVCGATGSTILWPSLLAKIPTPESSPVISISNSPRRNIQQNCPRRNIQQALELFRSSRSLAPLLLSSRSYHRGTYFRGGSYGRSIGNGSPSEEKNLPSKDWW
jgi:hypothetical protein